MPAEEIEKKFCRLDMSMVIEGRIVNLEIQVRDEGNFAERSMFHWAREYSSALPAGEDYSALPKTIIISIIDFIMFNDSDDVHSEFMSLEVNRHTPLTDKMSLHFFELKKLPNLENIDTANEKDLWLALFNAETLEEMADLEKLEVSFMTQAVETYREVASDPEYRYLEKLRATARHDEAQALSNNEKQTKLAMAKNLLSLGVSFEIIAQSSGLSIEEIERLA